MSVDIEGQLSREIQHIVETQSNSALQQLLYDVAESLDIEPLEVAAAIFFLDPVTTAAGRHFASNANQQLNSQHFENKEFEVNPSSVSTYDTTESELAKNHRIQRLASATLSLAENNKMVRYRLEIGHNHHVSVEDIKKVLINESGVDRSKIGYMDIRSNYTLIDLPPGMPPDIFQLLQTVEIKQQPLQIKRVSSSRKRPWKRRKNNGQNRTSEQKPIKTEDTKKSL